MRVVVTGASGNVGTSLLRALAREDLVESVLGVARRRPDGTFPKTTWIEADVSRDDLEPSLRGADAVVHLAWLIQPSRDEATAAGDQRRRQRARVRSRGRARACAGSCTPPLSAPTRRGRRTGRWTRRWPTDGIASSFYARHKSEVERMLDLFEARPSRRARGALRPGLIFKREAASEIRRLFAGPLLPGFAGPAGADPDRPRRAAAAVPGRSLGTTSGRPTASR